MTVPLVFEVQRSGCVQPSAAATAASTFRAVAQQSGVVVRFGRSSSLEVCVSSRDGSGVVFVVNLASTMDWEDESLILPGIDAITFGYRAVSVSTTSAGCVPRGQGE
ncbi:MAG: hypothetical protein HY907_11175 [Deltaproteobacteria bacterium]|nr:hypothetical protein [Deltaproteobacteria bacterium]